MRPRSVRWTWIVAVVAVVFVAGIGGGALVLLDSDDQGSTETVDQPDSAVTVTTTTQVPLTLEERIMANMQGAQSEHLDSWDSLADFNPVVVFFHRGDWAVEAVTLPGGAGELCERATFRWSVEDAISESEFTLVYEELTENPDCVALESEALVAVFSGSREVEGRTVYDVVYTQGLGDDPVPGTRTVCSEHWDEREPCGLALPGFEMPTPPAEVGSDDGSADLGFAASQREPVELERRFRVEGLVVPPRSEFAVDLDSGFDSIWALMASKAPAPSNEVVRVDAASGEIVARITVPLLVDDPPAGLDVAPDRVFVWTLSALHEIDPQTNAVVATVDLSRPGALPGAPPPGMAVGSGSVWVTGVGEIDAGDPEYLLWRLDPATGETMSILPIPVVGGGLLGPTQPFVAGQTVWVADPGVGLHRVDPATSRIAATIDLTGDRVVGMHLDDAGRLWATGRFSVFLLDTEANEISATVSLYRSPSENTASVLADDAVIVLNADGGFLRVGTDSAQLEEVYVADGVREAPLVTVADSSIWVVSQDVLVGLAVPDAGGS